MGMNSLTRLLLGLSFVIFSVNCQATVGYFALGYGAKSHAMAGATTAAPRILWLLRSTQPGLLLSVNRLISDC